MKALYKETHGISTKIAACFTVVEIRRAQSTNIEKIGTYFISPFLTNRLLDYWSISMLTTF